MAIGDQVSAREMAEVLVPALRAVPAVERFWVSTHRDLVTFWVLTAPVDREVEDRVYDVTTLIYERFPDAYFDFHLLRPDWFEDGYKEGDVLGGLPASAEEIPL